ALFKPDNRAAPVVADVCPQRKAAQTNCVDPGGGLNIWQELCMLHVDRSEASWSCGGGVARFVSGRRRLRLAGMRLRSRSSADLQPRRKEGAVCRRRQRCAM